MSQIDWRTEPKGNRKMSQLLLAWVLMLPLVVLAVHTQFSFMEGSRNSDQWQTFSSQITAPDQGLSNSYRVIIYPAYGVIAWLIFTNLKRVLRAVSECKIALLICGIVLASVVWSQDPVASLRGGIYYLVDTLFAFYLLAAFSLEELMDLTMMLGTTLAILSAVMIVAFPQHGLMHQTAHLNNWQGIFSHKNIAAENFTLLLTPVCNRRILQPRCMIYAVSIALLIVMTSSVTAIVVLPVYIAFMLCLPFFRRMSLRSAAFLTVTAISMAALSACFLVGVAPQLASFLGRDLTLSGRTEIWSVLLQSVREHPLLGYGYSAFWTGIAGQSGLVHMKINWNFASAHNGFLEILLQIGMIGMATVVLMLLQTAKNAAICVRGAASAGIDWLVGMIFLVTIYNFDESTILFQHTLVSVMLVMTCGGLAMARARMLERVRAEDSVGWGAAEAGAQA